MLNKRKKVVKYRGSKTHGGGSMKKRRGAGSRGGRGMAGTGKRGDVKKTKIWKNTSYFGKKGFKGLKKTEKTLNIATIETQALRWQDAGLFKETKGLFTIDLKRLGYTKLLAKGNPSRTYHLLIDAATASAKAKIEKAGGRIGDVKEQPAAPAAKA